MLVPWSVPADNPLKKKKSVFSFQNLSLGPCSWLIPGQCGTCGDAEGNFIFMEPLSEPGRKNLSFSVLTQPKEP